VKTCAHCGAPVKYVGLVKGWLHAGPLAELRISDREASDIHHDPPRPGEVLNRQSHIHPAQPG
jgi:hypothetical protein